MKKIIKIISLLSILLVILTFAACNPSSNNINNNQEGNISNGSINQEDNNQEGNNSNGSINQEDKNSIVQSGYSSISGSSSEPTTPFWCAYHINRTFDETDSYDFQLSFGTNTPDGWGNCNHVIVSVENKNGESYIYEELTAEEFFTEKYRVKINYTYIEFESNGNIYQEVDQEIFTFSYAENYQLPNSLCEGESGRLDFYITDYAQDEIVGMGFQDLYYRKSDGQIHFMTIKEYYETAGGTSVSKVTGTFGWYDDSDIWHPLPFVKIFIADISHFTFTPAIYTDENGHFEYTYSTASSRNINLIVYAGTDDAYAYTLTAPSISGTTLDFSWVVPRDSDMWQAFQNS
jgi:hypothetical protein